MGLFENLGGNNIHYLLIESSCSRLSRCFGVVANLLANPCATQYWYGQSKQLHLALSQLAHLESWPVGGLENFPFFPSYWECHHPNWLIFFRGRSTTKQLRKHQCRRCLVLPKFHPKAARHSQCRLQPQKRWCTKGVPHWSRESRVEGLDERWLLLVGDL